MSADRALAEDGGLAAESDEEEGADEPRLHVARVRVDEEQAKTIDAQMRGITRRMLELSKLTAIGDFWRNHILPVEE